MESTPGVTPQLFLRNPTETLKKAPRHVATHAGHVEQMKHPSRKLPRLATGRLFGDLDRQPSRRELLDEIVFLVYVIDALAADRNRLAGDLAELVVQREAES